MNLFLQHRAMFSVGSKLFVRLNSVSSKLCTTRDNDRRCFHYFKRILTQDDRTVRICNDCNSKYILKSNLLFTTPNAKCFAKSTSGIVREYSTEGNPEPKNENVFGDLGGNQYDLIEMDEDELAEEKLTENEARVRVHPKSRAYVRRIKEHLSRKDLKSALEVLDLIASHREVPTTYMYNLLLRACAVSGNFEKAKFLYNAMKQRGVEYNAATYTSMINACAELDDPKLAVEYLDRLRAEFAEKNVVLNDTHYNVMIKVYGLHGELYKAFEIVDIMRDLRLPTTVVTFNHLLMATISNKKAGLRLALIVWHTLRRHKIRPTADTYSLLLRGIRDAEFGDLKVNDVLIETHPCCQIVLNDSAMPNLLAQKPTVHSLAFTEVKAVADGSSEEVEPRMNKSDTKLPAVIDPAKNENSLVNMEKVIAETPLETIRKKNPLLLFGGLHGILQSMKEDNVTPDIKSAVFLMQLIPRSEASEEALINTMKKMKVPLNTIFYNVLMKKRCFNHDYKGAKDVLEMLQRSNLHPDIITWGILALCCKSLKDANSLMEGMDATGFQLNAEILSTLINNGCKMFRFDYVLTMMEVAKNNRIRPNKRMLDRLKEFENELNAIVKDRKKSFTTRSESFQVGYAKFKVAYPKWLNKMEELEEMRLKRKVHPPNWRQNKR